MLGSMGWDRLFVLPVAALVVLGPERLPAAMRWATRTLRQARDQINRAADHARTELGPELAGLRETAAAIAELRSDLRDLATAGPTDHSQPQPISRTPGGSAPQPPAQPGHPPIDPQAT